MTPLNLKLLQPNSPAVEDNLSLPPLPSASFLDEIPAANLRDEKYSSSSPSSRPGPKPHPRDVRYESPEEFAVQAIARENLIPGSTEFLKAKNNAQFRHRGDFNGYTTPRVCVPQHITKLFPKEERRTCLTAAITLGAFTNGREILCPQFRLYDSKKVFHYHHDLAPNAYNALWRFGYELGVQDFNVIVRTAIAAGLQWPGYKEGVFQPFRKEPYEMYFWVSLILKAGCVPRRPDRIPAEIFARIDTEGFAMK